MIDNWIRRSNTEGDKKLKILTFPSNERYETNLCKTGHNFYSFQHPELKSWDSVNPIPENYHIMPESIFYPIDGYDLILTQNRNGQFVIAKEFNKQLGIPIIALELDVISPNVTYGQLQKFGKMVGDVNVFSSNYSACSWNTIGIDRNMNVIEPCVDTKLFTPSESSLYSVYLNITQYEPVPLSLLEAMSSGRPVVALDNCDLSKIIEHGVNGMISENQHELDQYFKLIQQDKELAKFLGENARKTVLERFSEERFIKEWNEIFQKTYEASI